MKVVIKKSTNKNKKLMAIFYDINNKKIKTVHFGAYGYSDYTKHKNNNRKNAYIARHKSRENWNKYMTPGALSRWILWNKKTLSKSLNDYKNKFGLE